MRDSVLLARNVNMPPVNVQVELTEACNLRCKFCYNSQNPVVGSFCEDILMRLQEQGVLEVVLTGGEPMLHPHFKKIVRLALRLFPKVQVQTNGTFIDAEVADALIGVQSVNISLHGPAQIHDALTQREDSYEMAIRGMKEVLKRGIPLASNFVLTSENVMYFRENVVSLYKMGVRSFSLTRFTPTGVGSHASSLALSTDTIIAILYEAESLKKELPGSFFMLANSMPRCALPEELVDYCNYCHFGSSRFYVDVHGNLLMCGMSRVKIGNILKDSIKDIKSHSSVFSDLVTGEGFPSECRACVDFKKCRGGCRAAALAYTGDYMGRDPFCVK